MLMQQPVLVVALLTSASEPQPRSDGISTGSHDSSRLQTEAIEKPNRRREPQQVDEHEHPGERIDPKQVYAVVASGEISNGAERDPYPVVDQHVQPEHDQHKPAPTVRAHDGKVVRFGSFVLE